MSPSTQTPEGELQLGASQSLVLVDPNADNRIRTVGFSFVG
jgi:hypothetical protein